MEEIGLSSKMTPKTVIVFSLLLAVLSTTSTAKELTLAVNQTEYYFLVNENAIIPIEFENVSSTPIKGTLSYTITQEISQAGFQYSSSNSGSQPFTAPGGKQIVTFSAGTSDKPIKLTIDLTFAYGSVNINLRGIIVYFVQDQSQKQKNDERKESKQQNNQQQTSQQSNQQSKQSQMQQAKQQMQQLQQQMQEQMNKIFGSQQSKPDPMQAVQNNQMAQDSSALKQQLQKQMQEQQQMKQEFQNNLGQNPEFQQKHNDLTQQGYKPMSGNLDPTNSTSGNFEVNYEKGAETATVKGSMENNQMKEIQKTTSEDIKKIMDQLLNDQRYQQYSQYLQSQGYTPKQPEVQTAGNATSIKIPYQDDNNKTAAITAQIKNNVVEDIKLEKEKSLWWIWALSLPLLAIGIYFAYTKYLRKSADQMPHAVIERPIDYRKESRNMLDEAKKLYREKKYKDAYEKASQAVRFFYSHKLGIRIELTNSELIKHLKKEKISHEDTQKCLNLCSMVEFAKYQANDEDFNQIISTSESMIK